MTINSLSNAVLIDVMAIQKYVFGSNKLRENVGASFIVERWVFGELVKIAFKMTLDEDIDPGNWDFRYAPEAKAAIGYIGGGNALLRFEKENDASNFILCHSRLVRLHFPGLSTAYGMITDFNPNEDGFEASMDRLNKSLRASKSGSYIQNEPYKSGIVEDCALSNGAKEVPTKDKGVISNASFAKLDAVAASNQFLMEALSEEQKERFRFTEDIGMLGQPKEKGYVGVIHFDGNSMGQRFRNQKTLEGFASLSKEVASAASEVMKQLVNHVETCFDANGKLIGLNSEDEVFQLRKVPKKETKESQKYFLPFRPIISGGDDFTIVCEGRFSIHLTEKLITFFEEKKVDEKPIYGCAGVAIVKTKYPFFRAYERAEELTNAAKTLSRGTESSLLNYLISHSGFASNHSDAIQEMYSCPHGQLPYGPYLVKGYSADAPTLSSLKQGAAHFSKGPNPWPRSKIMELRDVLTKPSYAHKKLLLETRLQENRSLPIVSKMEAGDLWAFEPSDKKSKTKGRTPYYDFCEIIDFYPQPLFNA